MSRAIVPGMRFSLPRHGGLWEVIKPNAKLPGDWFCQCLVEDTGLWSFSPSDIVGGALRTGYKLFRLRKDGTLGPLFINRKQRIEVGVDYVAECHPTPGYAVRPGWHICSEQRAPHLSTNGRVWCRVEFADAEEHARPECQGGLWFTAKHMRVVEVLS